jgi:hypothetical protein
MTIHHLHCSEVSRWPRNGRETMASLRAAVVPGGEIVIESTPNGAGGMFYEEWKQAEENGYTQHFLPWWYEPAYVEEIAAGTDLALNDEEKSLRSRHGLSEEQIAWRRKQWREMRGLGGQEYAEDPQACFLASGECVFDMDAIESARMKAAPVAASQENGRILAWFPANHGPQWQYVIGVDSAGGGVDGDYACAQVIERASGLQCAELRGHLPPLELARRVAALGREYEHALVAVERNNQGYGVIAHLRDMRYENLYEQGGQLGWLTSAATRPDMIENLAAVLVARPELFHSPRLLDEMRTFVRHADGQGAATDGAHDDCVMAMAIALAVRRDDAGRIRRRPVEMASFSVG